MDNFDGEIKLFFTDLGRVLVSFEDRRDMLRQIVERLGGDPQGVDKIFASQLAAGLAGKEDFFQFLDDGTVDFPTLHKRLNQACGLQLSLERLAALYILHLKPVLPVIELYKKIQTKVPLVAISNGDWGSRYVTDMLTVHHGLKFKQVFTSCELGWKKPLLLNIANNWAVDEEYQSGDCLFIDDIPAYCQKAKELGMNVICFDATARPAEALQERLEYFRLI